jgi:hypothetical protein
MNLLQLLILEFPKLGSVERKFSVVSSSGNLMLAMGVYAEISFG